MKTEIIEASKDDIETILNFMEGYYQFDSLDYNREKAGQTLGEFIGSTMGSLFIVHSDDRPVGYFCLAYGYSLELHGRDCFLDELYIEEEYRRRGIGSEVMAFIEDFLRKKNIKSLHLIVFEKNIGAQQYYIRNSFRTRDAIFMTKSLA